MPRSACTTDVSVTFSFGGQTWTIAVQDMNHGAADPSGSLCLGSIFDLTQGTNVPITPGNPNWIIGDTFLVSCYFLKRGLIIAKQYATNCFMYYRKMSTLYFDHLHLPLGLRNFLPLPGDQVRRETEYIICFLV